MKLAESQLSLFDLIVADDEYADLWDVDRGEVEQVAQDSTPESLQWIDLPVMVDELPRTNSGEWADKVSIGVYARKDGTTAIAGHTEATGDKIMPTLLRALESLPNSGRLEIYTTVPPLPTIFTNKPRLRLPKVDKSKKVSIKLEEKYSRKGPLPTGNRNQWDVARQLGRHHSVKWFVVDSLPSAAKLLLEKVSDFTLDDIEELEF